jgi:ribosome-binding ATPase YchF (GTP1/OBG family)
MYVGNVLEEHSSSGNNHSQALMQYATSKNITSLIISAKIEAEIALLTDEEEKTQFIDDLGLKETGLNRIIKAGYNLLNLQSYFTVGPKEARAWTFEIGTLAPAAAGIIHTDFERGFIRAEVINYTDYILCGSEAKAKEQGKMRSEGKEYIVKDGDVIHFLFNV